MIEDNLDETLKEDKNILDSKFKKVMISESQKLASINPIPLTDAYHTQDQYIQMCNSSGLVLATCADYYNAAKNHGGSGINIVPDWIKTWKDLEESYKNENSSVRNAIRIFTGDVIEFSEHSYDAKIIRNYGSTIVKPTEITLYLPNYHSSIERVSNTIIGKQVLQAIFNTNDEPGVLMYNLNKIFSTKFNSDPTISIPDIPPCKDYLTDSLCIAAGFDKYSFRNERESIILEAEFPFLKTDCIRLGITTTKCDLNLTGRAYCLEKNKARVD